MIVKAKDAAKLIGISIIACCAVLVCTMFLNFYMDISAIRGQITSPQDILFYEAQVSTSQVVCMVSGGCLLVTSVIMLLFYIKHYIDLHKKELGILKALGYSNIKIAKSFWIFGVSTFVGTAAGFCGAFLLMPAFYELQNQGEILPQVSIRFHPSIFVYFVILPTVVFSVLAVLYGCVKLKKPVLGLLKENMQPLTKRKPLKEKKDPGSFISVLKRSTLRSKKTLVFFMAFAAFCFSAMTQMSFSMKELSSVMMGAMILLIGLVLACTTLFLAITTVVNGNTKTIAMMRVTGYSHQECCSALLGGYRPVAYAGFAVGTVYQYILLRLMVDIVFRDIADVPVYEFDFFALFISLAVFIVIYEIVMHWCAGKIKKISVKEIMLE